MAKNDTVPASEDMEPNVEIEIPQTKKMSIREITDEVGKLYEAMKGMVDSSQEEGAPMSGEKETKYDRLNQRLTSLITMRDQHYRLLDAQVAAQKSMERKVDGASRQISRTDATRGNNLMTVVGSEEYRSAFANYLRKSFRDLSNSEQRALSEGSDANGGFLPAQDFYTKLIEIRFQQNAMRQVANVIPLGTFETEITIESSFGTSTYIQEAAAKGESSPTFSNTILKPWTLRYFTKVSNELMSDSAARGSAFNVENVIASQIGRSMGLAEETAFATGTGDAAYSPTGIFNYATGSSPTMSGVTTAANYTLVQSELVDTVAALPRAYRANAKWIMTDEMFYKIRRMMQTQNAATASGAYAPYAWSLGDGRLQDGEPDRLLGYPIVCIAAGNAFPTTANAAGQLPVAIFGNFDYFTIGEREGVSIKLARETYLENNQTGVFAFARHGSVCTLVDAFRRLSIKRATA
jgi:HK97 family phage major capsid protein